MAEMYLVYVVEDNVPMVQRCRRYHASNLPINLSSGRLIIQSDHIEKHLTLPVVSSYSFS